MDVLHALRLIMFNQNEKIESFALQIYSHAAATLHEFHTNSFRRNKLMTRHVELSCTRINPQNQKSAIYYFYKS